MNSKLNIKTKKTHIGRNIAKVRTFRGVKQAALGSDLGISQQEMSDIEKLEEIPDDLLEQISDILGVSSDIIKNFDEQAVIYNISHYNDIHDNTYQTGSSTQVFHEPSEKIIDLYERLLNFLEVEKKKLNN